MKPTAHKRERCYICEKPLFLHQTLNIGDGFFICQHHADEERECNDCGETDVIGNLELHGDEWWCRECFDNLPDSEDELRRLAGENPRGM